MLYVIRHGKTDWNLKNKIQGRADIPLNNLGIQEANLTKKLLNQTKFYKIISSPLIRAKKTAEIISDQKTPIVIDSRIIERDFGLWEGIPFQCVSNWLTEQYILGKFDPPHGETYKHLQDRVYDFVTEMFMLHENKRILVVAHATILRMVRDLFLPKMEKKPIKNSQILIVTENDVINVKEE